MTAQAFSPDAHGLTAVDRARAVADLESWLQAVEGGTAAA